MVHNEIFIKGLSVGDVNLSRKQKVRKGLEGLDLVKLLKDGDYMID